MKTINVTYKGVTAEITLANFKTALQQLCELSPKAKKARMKNVIRSLDDTIAKMDSETPADSQTIANDVGIWFANEVIEGRSEQFKVMISQSE